MEDGNKEIRLIGRYVLTKQMTRVRKVRGGLGCLVNVSNIPSIGTLS